MLTIAELDLIRGVLYVYAERDADNDPEYWAEGGNGGTALAALEREIDLRVLTCSTCGTDTEVIDTVGKHIVPFPGTIDPPGLFHCLTCKPPVEEAEDTSGWDD